MVKTGEAGIEREIPVVIGDVVVLPEGVDETFGLPLEVVRQVSSQVLRALLHASIATEEVVFSGYDDRGNEDHAQKAAGDFASTGPEGDGKHEYFFGSVDDLEDGEEGPLAYAASGEFPVLGVYSVANLQGLGYEDGIVAATPAQILAAMVLEFRPQYRRVDE